MKQSADQRWRFAQRSALFFFNKSAIGLMVRPVEKVSINKVGLNQIFYLWINENFFLTPGSVITFFVNQQS